MKRREFLRLVGTAIVAPSLLNNKSDAKPITKEQWFGVDKAADNTKARTVFYRYCYDERSGIWYRVSENEPCHMLSPRRLEWIELTVPGKHTRVGTAHETVAQ